MFYITDIEQYVKSVSNCWKKAHVRAISSIQIVKKKNMSTLKNSSVQIVHKYQEF